MDFVTIVDRVLADGFDEDKRSEAQDWVNARYAWIVDNDEWTFKDASASVTVTAGSMVVSGMPSDFGVALGLHRADGGSLTPIDQYRDFAARYVGTSNTQQGLPEAFCVVGSSIFVGPASSETSTGYLLVYERDATLLSADTDTPILPTAYHVALIHGAKAEGFKLSNVPMADAFDADYQAYITAMKRRYLVAARGTGAQVPRYRPGR